MMILSWQIQARVGTGSAVVLKGKGWESFHPTIFSTPRKLTFIETKNKSTKHNFKGIFFFLKAQKHSNKWFFFLKMKKPHLFRKLCISRRISSALWVASSISSFSESMCWLYSWREEMIASWNCIPSNCIPSSNLRSRLFLERNCIKKKKSTRWQWIG